MPSVTAIIQARMGSTRLPGKSLRVLGGIPVIAQVVKRARSTVGIDKVVVATTTDTEDDRLADYLESEGVMVFRGDAQDVLDRYVAAARAFGGEVIVRLTGDDPLKDPAVIGLVLQRFLEHPGRFDYVSNTIQPTFPEGQDTEVFSAESLMRLPQLTSDPFDHEHVTPFFYRNQQLFRCLNVTQATDDSSLRWTLDTDADLRFFERLFSFFPSGHMITMQEAKNILAAHPDIALINSQEKRSAQYIKA